MKRVGIIMGSDSDLPVMAEAARVLEEFGAKYEIDIVSAHRTPDKMYDYAKTARERGLGVIIAAAGGAAHLPGMTASFTDLPVIGVPMLTKALSGVDSLYSIVQMPGGIPVATVAVNGAANAALLALRILAVEDGEMAKKLTEYAGSIRENVEIKSGKLSELGYEKYLSEYK